MAITPQAIKDQEFQSKFRGYDTVEVKAYLELVAEEFFELLERMRQQEQEISELTQENELAAELKERLENDIEASQRTVEDLRKERAAQAELEEEFNKEIEEMQTALDDFEQERKELEEEVSAAGGRVLEIEEKLQQGRTEIDGLRNKIEMLEEQNQDLKKEEVDFKRTIGTAQRFADDLVEKTREETDAMITESEEKASAAVQAAQEEIENLRREAFDKLSRLPEEIQQLYAQRKRVREQLGAILSRHLEELDSYSDADEEVKKYEYDELFQKVEIFGEKSTSGSDELDDINMDLSSDEPDAAEQEDGPGGDDIAFLSGN